MIKIGVKGKIIKGTYAPRGELIVEKAAEDDTEDYYIYVWPNDGTKWPDTNDDVVYDIWHEDFEGIEVQFRHYGWEVEWYSEEEEEKRKKEEVVERDYDVKKYQEMFERMNKKMRELSSNYKEKKE